MEWGEDRLMDEEEAIDTKAEQALLEIEHLVSGASDVEFTVEGDAIHHEPSEELARFLERQADDSGLEPEELLRLHVDLFARVFLEDDGTPEPDPELPDDPRPDRR